MSNLHPPLSLVSTLRRTCVALVFVCALLAVFTSRAQAAQISGRVTDIHGEPIYGVAIELYQFVADPSNPPGYWMGTGSYTYAGVNGEYTLTNIVPGTYRLGFARRYEYRDEFFDNKGSVELATDIVVNRDNDTLTGYDAVLAFNGLIFGKVVDPDNNPIEGVTVSVIPRIDSLAYDYTDQNGDFGFGVQSDGPYSVYFESNSPYYVSEYYDDKFTLESADLLSVHGDEIITLTVQLSRTKTISGTVLDTHHNRVDALVDLYKLSEDNSWSHLTSYSTNERGEYYFIGLSPAQYRVEFTGDSFVSEYYNNQSDFDAAEILDFTNGSDVIVANAEVTRRGIVTGTVTNQYGEPFDDVRVYFRYEENGEWLFQNYSTWTDSRGYYEFDGALPDRNYLVHFQATASYYLEEFYDNVYSIESAQTINVPIETTLSNINAQLESYGIITGTVTDANGSLLQDATVEAFDRSTGNYRGHTETDANGHYTLSLEPGKEFSIRFSHPMYEAEFYDNQTNLNAGNVVTAPINGIVPNINAQLATGPLLSGTVTDNNGDLLGGITIGLFDEYENYITAISTDQNGHYAVRVAPGSYYLGFNNLGSQTNNENYAGEFYENAATQDQATAIVITSGNDREINAELAIIPSISGRVTDQQGQPSYGKISLIKRTVVDGVVQWEDTQYVVTTYNEGKYAIRRIEPGEYAVLFVYDIFQNEYDEYYDNKRTLETATILTVTSSSLYTDINATWDEPGKLIVTVVNSANEPLPGIENFLYNEATLAGSFAPAKVVTDENGQFVWNIFAEPRWLAFNDPTGQYAGEFYDNQVDVENAKAITMAYNSTLEIKVELGASAWITGHVSDMLGQPLQSIAVELLTYWPQQTPKWQLDGVASYTNADGNYRLDGLTPGRKYRVQFSLYDRSISPPQRILLYYPSATTLEGAQEVVIPSPMLLPNINMTMPGPGQVYAQFNGTPSSGLNPLIVNFSDQSFRQVTSRSWDFGDGGTSSETNPSHTYNEVGTYTVTLTVTGAANNDVETKVGYITVSDTPIANVGIEQNNPGGNPQEPPKVGQTLYFSATATGSNVQFLWDFGDGALSSASTATGQYVQHSYTTPGNYIVTLTARNGVDEEVTTMPLAVQDDEDPPIEEPVSVLVLNAPSNVPVNSTVALSATAAGDNITYAWDFGDGAVGTGSAVNHVYATVGTYTITLTASNRQGEVAATKQITVQGAPTGEEPVSALVLNAPSNVLVNSTVAFSATAAGDNINYAWDFGDGGVGTGKEASHIFTAAGTYTITLTASNTQGEVEATSEIVVTNHTIRLPNLQR